MPLAKPNVSSDCGSEEYEASRFAASLLFLATAIALLVTENSDSLRNNSCATFLALGWGKLYGFVPINWLGSASFAMVYGLYQGSRRDARLGISFWIASSTIISAAVWFLGVQLIVFNKWCVACCGSLALAVLGVFLLLNQFVHHYGRPSLKYTAITTLGTIVFLWWGSPLAKPEKTSPYGDLDSAPSIVQ